MNIINGLSDSRLRELLFNRQTEPHYNDGSITEKYTTMFINEYVNFRHVIAMVAHHVPDLKTSPALNVLETTADNLELWSMSHTGEVTVKRIAHRLTVPAKHTTYRLYDLKRLIEAIKLLSPEYGTIEIRQYARFYNYSDGDFVQLPLRTELFISVGNTRIRWTAIEELDHANPIRPLIEEHKLKRVDGKDINAKDLNKACATYLKATENKRSKDDVWANDRLTTISTAPYYSVTHELNITPSRQCQNYMHTYMQTLPFNDIQLADARRINERNDERKQKAKQHSMKLGERHQTIVNEYPEHLALIKLLNLDDHYYIGRDECKALGIWGDTIRLTEDHIRSMLHKTKKPIVIVRDKLNTLDDNPIIIYPTTPHNQRTEQRAETTPNRLAIVPIAPIITRVETLERWRVNSNAIVAYCPPQREMVVYTPPTPKPTPPKPICENPTEASKMNPQDIVNALKHNEDPNTIARNLNVNISEILAQQTMIELGLIDTTPAPATPATPVTTLSNISEIPGLIVTYSKLCIWIGGDTYPHRHTLKALGYRWSPKKKLWYQSREAVTAED